MSTSKLILLFLLAGFIAGLMTGCAHKDDKYSSQTQPQFFTGRVAINNGMDSQSSPYELNAMAPAAGEQYFEGRQLGAKGSREPSSYCRVKDRFDRKDVVAYHFADGKSRLGLNVDMDGFGLRNLGNVDVKAVGVNFRYRFQPIKKRREKCLYASSWQGLFGSGYNEFFVREEQTVYEHLDDEFDHVQDEVHQLLGR